MSNPLVAGPAAPAATEGAGALSSWADLAGAVASGRPDGGGIAFCAAAAGLDSLGVALHPFDAMLAAGLGWLVEHVEFLREPLDVLAGDAAVIAAAARTWHDVAGELRSVAAGYRAAAVPEWHGAAADAYRGAAGGLTASMDTAAGHADVLADLILATGAAVGTVRAAVRDAIAEFLALVVEYVLAAGALALLTAGGSLGAMVASVVVRATELAAAICGRLAELLRTLAAAGTAAGRAAEAMRAAAARARTVAPLLRVAGEAFDGAASDAYAPVFVEAGKQATGAARERRTWAERGG